MGGNTGATLVALATVLGALAAICVAVGKIPPLRAVVRFLVSRVLGPAWRAIAVEPTRLWFKEILHSEICPLVKESVDEAVPSAVAAAIGPALEPLRAEIVGRAELTHGELLMHRNEELGHRTEIVARLQSIEDRVLAVPSAFVGEITLTPALEVPVDDGVVAQPLGARSVNG